ncbi:sensor histidine kinase [Chryseomicrobium sp. FSL W7-1435]|uniref:sensor histidine kinase n=1 Tax=Chryseomicrobium sp. FSL W7-1435 TaxID=2921704 RepID=UPI00315A9AD6
MNRSSLQFRLAKYMLILAMVVLVLVITASYFVMAHSVRQEIGERALNIAETTAQHPEIIRALQSDTPSLAVQELALSIQQEVEAQYVVVGDENEIRYAHPIADRIGEKMVGDDNTRALENGESYISEATGTLGKAIRGKAPVVDADGTIIGIVSVGFLLDNIFLINLQYAKYLAIIFIVASLLSVILSRFLSGRIKKQLLDYEPVEIASLLSQRNALLESIREAIIVIDNKGMITLSNPAADAYFPALPSLKGQIIENIIPQTRLVKVLQSGKVELDQVISLNGIQTLVNRIPISKDGKVTGAVASFRRIEDIDAIAEELAQTKDYIESLRAQTHEHQNFLYMISGLLQLKEYDEAIEFIHHEQLETTSLLAFITKHIEDTHLNAMVIGFYNRARELKIHLELDEDSACSTLPPTIAKHLLLPLLSNLVVNAFEAVDTHRESERIVRFYVKESDTEFIFEIEDSGPGISPEKLPQLLEGKQSTKNKTTRGYGLAIVQENLNLLSGQLSVEHGDLGGALFVVSIPIGGKRNDGSN